MQTADDLNAPHCPISALWLLLLRSRLTVCRREPYQSALFLIAQLELLINEVHRLEVTRDSGFVSILIFAREKENAVGLDFEIGDMDSLFASFI